MPKPHNIAVMVGSLRAQSITRKLADALVARAPDTLDCAIVPIDLPLYNEDLDNDPPAAWADFRGALATARGMLFVTPEYNRTIPGGLKNAIDVGSRPYGRGAMLGKPAAVVSQTPGPLGGTLANHAVRQAVVFLDMPVMQQPELYIARSRTLFGPDGELEGDDVDRMLTGFMAAFALWVGRFASAGS